jgi:hypothetical protein
MTEAEKLQLLSELAAAKGHPELADDLRRVARFLCRAEDPDTDEASRLMDPSILAGPRIGWSNDRP